MARLLCAIGLVAAALLAFWMIRSAPRRTAAAPGPIPLHENDTRKADATAPNLAVTGKVYAAADVPNFGDPGRARRDLVEPEDRGDGRRG